MTAIIIGGQARQLGSRIGKGGEGEIFALADDKTLVVKLYTVHERASREAKVAAMVRAELAKRSPLVAFPLSLARRRDGSFAGFVMRLVEGHKPLHELYAPGPRKHHFPHADYRFLVRTATNIARAVASVHRSNCVIGDINHSSMLVSPKAVVALIDADSFQVSDNDQRYLCRVGVPEYTPPELQGKALAGVVRTPNHDAFGLAVVTFQLLFMGRHPFVGTVRRGEIPPLHENIGQYRYVYAENRDVGMDQPPGTPAISDFSPAIASLFDAAFSRNTADRRPTAEHWVQNLEKLESSLTRCDESPLHYGPRDASECAWCEMERQLGTFLFLPYLPGSTVLPGADPGASGFNVDLLWAKIEGIRCPTREQLKPRVNRLAATPSQAARDAKRRQSKAGPLGVGIAMLAGVALLALPQFFVIWIAMIFWGISTARKKASFNSAPFERAFVGAEGLWARELENWYRRTEMFGNPEGTMAAVTIMVRPADLPVLPTTQGID